MNGLLNIGQSALMAQQTAINVVGNNIANVDTIGYSRQFVRFESTDSIDGYGGQLGQGVNVAEIDRQFSRFVEDAYLDRFAPHSRWSEQSKLMSSVETIFNESDRYGISVSMSDFFADWQKLAKSPNDAPTKEQLLSSSELLASLIRDAQGTLEQTQREMDLYIEQGVREVNEILGTIADLNQKIAETDIPGMSNSNQLLDQRDLEVRKLAGYIDIDVKDYGSGDMRITTTAGHTLLEEGNVYSLDLADGRVENHLRPESDYDGTVEFEGSDTHEYTFEILTPADAAAVPPENGSMRVSLDGGKTWMRNSDGSQYIAKIPHDNTLPVMVKDLEINFTGDTSKLLPGDSFEVLPKKILLWNSPTSDPMNITPQTFGDGSENSSRVVNGTLAAYFSVRDENVGKYMDQLDSLAENLIWEVNRSHSQGAGIGSMNYTYGTTDIGNSSVPMGDSWSGLPFNERLTSGAISFQIYDDNGEPVDAPLLDFDPLTPGVQNFDPAIHSVDDLQDAINDTYAGFMQADIIDGKLQLTSVGDHSFSVRSDATGALAALGVNTFFQGEDASTIGLKADIRDNLDFINSGSVQDEGNVTVGDGSTALAVAALAKADFTFDTGWESSTTGFASFYGGVVGGVGSDTRTAHYNNDYNTALAMDLSNTSNSYSGVNLDEEMSSLIRFQHSYTAAAKLITTADQMLQTLLGLKQ